MGAVRRTARDDERSHRLTNLISTTTCFFGLPRSGSTLVWAATCKLNTSCSVSGLRTLCCRLINMTPNQETVLVPTPGRGGDDDVSLDGARASAVTSWLSVRLLPFRQSQLNVSLAQIQEVSSPTIPSFKQPSLIFDTSRHIKKMSGCEILSSSCSFRDAESGHFRKLQL